MLASVERVLILVLCVLLGRASCNALFPQVHFAVTGQQHGTFLGNCEREREELRLAGTTTSAWLPLLTSEIGLNPAFEPLDDVIAPDSVLSSGGARLWVDMYRPHF